MLATVAYADGDISIRPPIPEVIRNASIAADVAASVSAWLSRAVERDDICYFSVHEGERLVGQILLHDIQWPAGEALVAYHLFQPSDRGRGIGTRALAALQRFVADHTTLSRLIIITSSDNLASRRLAERCGFHFIGPPREDPSGVALEWTVWRQEVEAGEAGG
jgi:RimJ/RimL family protein N-acetyltransferase